MQITWRCLVVHFIRRWRQSVMIAKKMTVPELEKDAGMADDMDYLEDIRFLFEAEDSIAEQDAMADDMEDYLEDIRFLFDAEDTAMETDDYLEDIRFLFDEEDTTAAGDAKGAKWVKDVAQKLKKMKKGVKKFFGRLGEAVRHSFCCCVSVEE